MNYWISFLGFVFLCLGAVACSRVVGHGDVRAKDSHDSARIILKTFGPPMQLYGVQFKLNLPPGLTLPTRSNGEVDAGNLVPLGSASGALVVARYQPTLSASILSVSLASENGFSVGDFLAITADLSSDAIPEAIEPTILEFKAYDNRNGIVSDAVTGTLEVTKRMSD